MPSGAANDVLHDAVGGHRRDDQLPGLVNVDFADVRTVMSEIGMAMMGSADDQRLDRARIAAEAAVAKPAARRRRPRRRARRAGQHHRRPAQDEGVSRGHEHHQGIHRRGGDGDRRHGDRRARWTTAARHHGGDRSRCGQGRAAGSRKPARRDPGDATGTDNEPVGTGIERSTTTNSTSRPWSAGRARPVVRRRSIDTSDIPAFLRKQAD